MPITRSDFQRRYCPPGTDLTPTQWRHVATFLAVDDLLDTAGRSSGRTFIRAALVRYLLDRDSGIPADLANEATAAARWAQTAPPQLATWDDRPPRPVPALTRAGQRLAAEAARLDNDAGRAWDNVPARVAAAVSVALDPDPTPPHGTPRPSDEVSEEETTL